MPGVGLSEPSPQRTPVIFQAGTSPRGYVGDLRARAAELGRDPRSLKIFTEITTVVADTDEAAQRRYEHLLSYVDYESTLAFYAGVTGVDLVVPELRRRGRVWDDYEAATLRENIYEPGQRRLRDDHPGARYRPA